MHSERGWAAWPVHAKRERRPAHARYVVWDLDTPPQDDKSSASGALCVNNRPPRTTRKPSSTYNRTVAPDGRIGCGPNGWQRTGEFWHTHCRNRDGPPPPIHFATGWRPAIPFRSDLRIATETR